MKLIKSKNFSSNYLAKVVQIDNFVTHPDPEVDRLKIAIIDGFRVIMGIDSKPGIYIYFPTLSEVNPDFLAFANLYRDAEKNSDPTKKGYFENNGKVSAIKLRGVVSEGFIIESEIFQAWLLSSVAKECTLEPGTEFDSVEDSDKTFWVNRKYVKKFDTPQRSGGKSKTKQIRGCDKVIPTQFRFHYDTNLLKKTPWVIHPDDIISITSKVHGTSGISAYVLCRDYDANWWQRIGNWITRHIIDPVFALATDKLAENTHYDYLYASRTVIKNQYYNNNVSSGYYNCDVWAYAHNVVKDKLVPGMTLYYEIIGYLPNGGYIQKGYDYECVPPAPDEDYTVGKHFKVLIYRVTMTSVEGQVHEFSAKEVQQWCKNNGLVAVTELYYGYAKSLYPELDLEQHWCENFLDKLANDKNFYMELKSPDCNNNVPHEGIVIKTETMRSEAWKLKTFKFLRGEIENDEANIEDNA